MRFEVLGPLAVWTSDGRSVRVPDRKVRALLADLLVHDGRVAASERLIDDLWGEELPVNPASTLQTRVSQLRRALEDAEPGGRSLVVTQPPGYLLRIDPEQADIGCFRALVSRARETSDARTRASVLVEALALWRGPAFADVADESFAVAAGARLEEERLTALEACAEARLELGEHDALVAQLGELVAQQPLRERLRAAYMRALYRCGRHSEALEAFHDLRIRLTEELGLDPSPELSALHQAMLTRDPVLTPAVVTGSNLPTVLTGLVGRQDAMDGLCDRLKQGRLLTLTGPGGVGKTRLAVETARLVADQYADGAWLVELTDLPAHATPAQVSAAVTQVVDVAGRQLLIVLDNCEHVIDAATTVTDRLLRQEPRLRVLATSREALGIFGEQTWQVPPLDLPDEDDARSEAAGEYSAVRLFVARVADAVPGFQITAGNAREIVDICRRLDGLPLALELAATRVRALGVRDLAARLDDRFRMLATRQRGVPDRQQTLRAVIEWSWDLLTEPERIVLRRLALHTGACTLHAAEAVCAGGEIADYDVADLLARLVDRSLVVRLEGMSGLRYRLLETVRGFCLDRLAEAGEVDPTRERYAQYYDRIAERSEPRLFGYGELFDRFGDIYQKGPDAEPIRPGPGGSVQTVISKDGTSIAFQQWGEGAPVILVANTLADRRALAPLALRLARHFTAIVYDRRGRGSSTDRPPYAVAREIEDLAALVERAGRPVFAFGVTTGAVLAGEAAAHGVEFAGRALIEPPFILDGTREPIPAELTAQLDELIAAGRRGDAVELFLTVAVQMTPEVLAPMRSAPRWQDLKTLAHTISYDMAVMNGSALPAHWSGRVTQPTLVIDGGLSVAWRRHAAQAVADALPNAAHLTMDGHPHDPDPDVLAPILEEFFLGHCRANGPQQPTV